MKRGVASRFVSGIWPQKGPQRRGLVGSAVEMECTVQMLLATFFVLFASIFAFQYYSAHYLPIAEGTTFMGEDISGLLMDEVEDHLKGVLAESRLPALQLEVNFGEGEQAVVPISLSDWGVSYDLRATVDQIVEPNKSYMASVVDGGTLHGASFQPVLDVPDTFLAKVFEAVSDFERPVRQALIDFDDEWFMAPSQTGVEFSESVQHELYQTLMQLHGRLDEEVIRIPIALETIVPEQQDDDVKGLYEELQGVLQGAVEWEIAGQSYVLRLSENPDFVKVDLAAEVVALDPGKIQLYVQSFAHSFDRDRGEVLIDEAIPQEKGYLKASYSGDFQRGRKVDQDAMFDQLMASFASELDYQKIEVPWMEEEPVLEMSGVGLLSKLSTGQSSYVLSHSEDRTFNVKKGLGKYDGVVIPQGAEFSFNDILGYVRYEDGWKPALAIFGGGGVQPVPGGGLCQVSTTTYRAAIHAGLQVTQRKPHSLDVSYYRAYGDGIDSTIYPPEDIDLKFVNDTPGPIFIHTSTDDEASEAFVEFYGIDDGREVELKQLVNRPVNLASEVIYTEELPQGVKEETKPRQGRYVEWEWKITRDGESEYRKIETLYPARKRTVRVGTGPAQLSYQ